MNYKLDFFTEHHQFYISDKEYLQDTGDIDFWTEAATQARLAIGDGILGVGIECYGSLEVALSILDGKKEPIAYDQYDHIVEGGLEIKSGILQVLDCPDTMVVLEVKVPPGKYRARIYSLNLASVVNDSGDDYYEIEIWPDPRMERTVLKQYP